MTPKEQKAIDYFIVHRTKSDAYRHAYSCGKMKIETIHRKAVELFDKPHIAEAVATAINKISDDAKIDATWVLKRAALLADFNIRKFIKQDDNGNAAYDFSVATDDDWYCISEYTVDVLSKGNGDDAIPVDRVKLKVFDKLKALELVGKHIDVQAFSEKVEHRGAVTTIQMTPDEYKKARGEALELDDC